MRHDLAMQAALYSALTSAPAIKAHAGDPARVYDHVPQNAVFPYITIGEITATEGGTKSADGEEQRITVHCWAQSRGRKTVKEMASAVYDTLHKANLSVAGANLVSINWIGGDSFPDADGETYHAVVQFRAILFDAE